MNRLIEASVAASAFAAALLPESAAAVTLVQFVGLFHLFTGLLVTMTFGVFFGGVFVYFMRLGTWPTHRDTAIHTMEWGIAMLFVLLVILGIVNLFQGYPRVALTILAVGIMAVIAYFVLQAATAKEKKKPAPRPGAR